MLAFGRNFIQHLPILIAGTHEFFFLNIILNFHFHFRTLLYSRYLSPQQQSSKEFPSSPPPPPPPSLASPLSPSSMRHTPFDYDYAVSSMSSVSENEDNGIGTSDCGGNNNTVELTNQSQSPLLPPSSPTLQFIIRPSSLDTPQSSIPSFDALLNMLVDSSVEQEQQPHQQQFHTVSNPVSATVTLENSKQQISIPSSTVRPRSLTPLPQLSSDTAKRFHAINTSAKHQPQQKQQQYQQPELHYESDSASDENDVDDGSAIMMPVSKNKHLLSCDGEIGTYFSDLQDLVVYEPKAKHLTLVIDDSPIFRTKDDKNAAIRRSKLLRWPSIIKLTLVNPTYKFLVFLGYRVTMPNLKDVTIRMTENRKLPDIQIFLDGSNKRRGARLSSLTIDSPSTTLSELERVMANLCMRLEILRIQCAYNVDECQTSASTLYQSLFGLRTRVNKISFLMPNCKFNVFLPYIVQMSRYVHYLELGDVILNRVVMFQLSELLALKKLSLICVGDTTEENNDDAFFSHLWKLKPLSIKHLILSTRSKRPLRLNHFINFLQTEVETLDLKYIYEDCSASDAPYCIDFDAWNEAACKLNRKIQLILPQRNFVVNINSQSRVKSYLQILLSVN